ncbi:hypothetical protein FDF26_12745 [Clostridium botulinum]|nr:hypothetical protein [Clostridium botulinum]
MEEKEKETAKKHLEKSMHSLGIYDVEKFKEHCMEIQESERKLISNFMYKDLPTKNTFLRKIINLIKK